jgi:hypothetical protein
LFVRCDRVVFELPFPPRAVASPAPFADSLPLPTRQCIDRPASRFFALATRATCSARRIA